MSDVWTLCPTTSLENLKSMVSVMGFVHLNWIISFVFVVVHILGVNQMSGSRCKTRIRVLVVLSKDRRGSAFFFLREKCKKNFGSSPQSAWRQMTLRLRSDMTAKKINRKRQNFTETENLVSFYFKFHFIHYFFPFLIYIYRTDADKLIIWS